MSVCPLCVSCLKLLFDIRLNLILGKNLILVCVSAVCHTVTLKFSEVRVFIGREKYLMFLHVGVGAA
jgi:hypothetical protein